MTKCIIYMPADKTKPAVMFTPNMGDRRCAISADGEKTLVSFPEIRAAMVATAQQFPADQVKSAPSPFPGMAFFRPETDDEMMLRHISNAIIVPGDATDVHVVEAEEIPPADDFRNTWIVKDGKISFDMPKARDAKRDQIRAARATLFTGLDIEYMRLQEQANAARKEFDAASKLVTDKMLASVKVSEEEVAASNAAQDALADIEARQADIVARKQALRDAPADPRIDAATTIDELRAIPLPDAS